jgi:hypothetical protein
MKLPIHTATAKVAVTCVVAHFFRAHRHQDGDAPRSVASRVLTRPPMLNVNQTPPGCSA